MKADEELFLQIIKDSEKKLMTLKLLANFFNHPALFNVIIKTTIIHSLFENNKSLDINKLELFHIQYTKSLIDLFQKLKKQKEQKYLLIVNEIAINDDFILKLNDEIDESKFHDQFKLHAQNMSENIALLYQMFEADKTTLFTWNNIINSANNYKNEYYTDLSVEQYEQLTNFTRNTYQNAFVKFEKRLLGRLHIFKFKIKFVCGFICNNEVIEVYQFRDLNERFIFVDKDKSFYYLHDEDLKELDLSKNHSKKYQVINQLKIKNTFLTDELRNIKTAIPADVQTVLNSYVSKISSVNFLDELQNVDEQTNILKAMLNININ